MSSQNQPTVRTAAEMAALSPEARAKIERAEAKRARKAQAQPTPVVVQVAPKAATPASKPATTMAAFILPGVTVTPEVVHLRTIAGRMDRATVGYFATAVHTAFAEGGLPAALKAAEPFVLELAAEEAADEHERWIADVRQTAFYYLPGEGFTQAREEYVQAVVSANAAGKDGYKAAMVVVARYVPTTANLSPANLRPQGGGKTHPRKRVVWKDGNGYYTRKTPMRF